MPKTAKPKQKQEPNIEATINIGGDVSGSNIIVGHGNTINLPVIKTEYTLFTIPLSVKDFTGREKELASLKDSFKNGALISGVSGGGGIGKTQLARKLAQDIADDFPDARISIDLCGTTSPLVAEEAMRRILEPFFPNQKLPDEAEQLKGLYQQTFSAQKALLLLDNASNAAQVRLLIPPTPSAAIVTSRRHISLTEFDLLPLHLDVLSIEDARALLTSASPKLKAGSDAEVNALAHLCGYLPLALRVAASLLNDRADWLLSHLLARLADERTRLQRLKRDEDAPDFDVEAVLGLSYDLLDESQKGFFSQLGVFTAPFIKISAQAVWQIEDENEADDVIGKLSAMSLLNILPKPLEGGIHLYELHDLTRLFSENQLLKDEVQAAQVSLRHANHFLEWAGETNALYEKGNEYILPALLNFRFIWRHLESAYNRLIPKQGSFFHPSEADEWLSKFPIACIDLLNLKLSPRRRIPILEIALNAARRLKKRQIESAYLGNLGIAYNRLGATRKSIEFHEQALVIVHEIGDRRGEGATLGNLGNAYIALGNAHKAIEFYEQALVIDREIGDRHGEGADLGNLGLAYAALGNERKAIEIYERALVIDREFGDQRTEGVVLGNIGVAHAALGDERKALEFYKAQLVIVQKIGDRYGEANAIGNLGNTYRRLGDVRKSIKFYKRALTIDREIGNRHGEGRTLGSLGLAYVTLGDVLKALEFYEQRLVIACEIDDRQGEGTVLGNLGNAYTILSDAHKAIEFYERALAILREIGDLRGEGAILGGLGIAYETLGEKENAIQYSEQALAIFEAIESPSAEQARKQLAKLRWESPT